MAVDTLTPTTGADEGTRVVASFATYDDAQRAVDRLADAVFPVERIKIVGHDLTFVERVTGRRTNARAAGEGAVGGALIAGFLGVLFGLLNWFDPIISALLLGLYGVVFGAIIGAVVGLLMHALRDGERDFASIRSVGADRFDVVADAEIADRARSAIGA